MYTLVIGNKNYSSWSLRAWLAMRMASIPFEEEVVPLDQPDTKERILARSPAGRVPVLIDGDLHIWESIAIIEYLHERHPHAGLWPASSRARAVARAVSAEMHAGFTALRSAYHMNIRRRSLPHPDGIPEAVAADIARITEIWRTLRTQHGADGPFLFGPFSAADAMFAPVTTRIETYAVPVGDVERAYIRAVLGLPAFAEWRIAAEAEPWVIPDEEVD